ncbi:hypothetical protein F4604DRAFT_1724477 [Suillus subluteus]|nr:hypothetical protein F4604DRAFT_1724477 [Suillus subluteus]
MPLLWMREEAFEAGLLLNPPKVAFTSEDLKEPKITNSLTLRWWLLEMLPIRHLRYNNSNQHTPLPHLGQGRIILPGQKVHASVLFRPNYRSKASFWRNLQQWPEAIYFHVGTDEQVRSRSSQDALAQTQAWEVPFKRSTAEALVGTIHKKHVLDYVDRLAFMCSFELGVEAVREVNPLETLEAILGIHGKKEHDPQVRLSAVVAYCGLDLDVLVLLKDEEPAHQGRACAALPALCGIRTLRKKLLKEDLIHRILELCRTAGENQLIAMKTLSYLAQHFDETSHILSRRPDFIKEILVMLKDKLRSDISCSGNIPKDTLSGIRRIEIVERLKRLIKRRDFFVTPAAVAALCKICQNAGILVTLIDLLEFDKQGLSGGPRGLMTLAEFSDVRNELARGPHIGKLVRFSRDKAVEKSNEATEELTTLSKYGELRKKIIDKGGLDSIVDNLAKPDHALFAADCACILSTILTGLRSDDAKERILNTEVDLHLLQMVKERIFDGTISREGMDILAEIFKNCCAEHLRSITLKPNNKPSLDNGSWNFGGKNAPRRLLKKSGKLRPEEDDTQTRNIIGILRQMIETTQLDSVQNSAISYLRIIADHEDARQEMIGAGIIEPLLWCLKATGVDNRALKDVLEMIARNETLRSEITENGKILAEMLSREIRQKVQEMGEYQNLKKDTLHYLDPHHHPHEHDQYTSASQAIESIIRAYDKTTLQANPLFLLFLFLMSVGTVYSPLLAIT